MKPLLLLLMAVMLSGSACNPTQPDPGNPVAVSSCPERLPPLVDDTFGATVNKLVEVTGIYFKCRTAAVGTTKE
jgi:hypothetical protein